ncbi:MAG: hypothetical protein BBJ60_12310 [Desulfobacterales bacterium S7086C20]|nr:MAG: hypothetical protein BBJ60_12310 [Desulfobacterales bacterium S7086C20]
MALSGKEALDVILESLTPAHLIQSLAEEDLYWLVQDIGPEDALFILSRATNEQWQYLLDLELWHKDRLEGNSVNRWMRLLLKADPERFLIWGLKEHSELIKLHLFKNIDVKIREEDESPSDFGDDYFSLDDVFYIRIEERYYQTIKAFLERLAGHDLDKFHQILLEMPGVLPAETEEDAYRFRNVRLAEKGFLPFEEAVGIYQHLSAEMLLEREPGIQTALRELHIDNLVPVSMSLLIEDLSLFHKGLASIEDNYTAERLQREFAAMCNQIISADNLKAREKEDLVSVVGKACGYLDIGLERITHGELHRIVSFLDKFPLNQIFRVGYGAALELKWKAERWIKKSWFVMQGLDTQFWEDEWGGMLDGLLMKRPLFYTSFSDAGKLYREFKNLKEITHCGKGLDQIIAFDQLLSLVFARAGFLYPTEAYHAANCKNLLLTYWSLHYLGLEKGSGLLDMDQLKIFFEHLWTSGEKSFRVKKEMKGSCLDWLVARSGLTSSEVQDLVGAILDAIFEELEKEYGSVSVGSLDPRYVRHFLVAP